MVFFYPEPTAAAFESEILSPFQNAAGAMPFAIYPNSVGPLSDPSILTGNQSLFWAAIQNQKFGMKSLSESFGVIGLAFKKYHMEPGFILLCLSITVTRKA